MFGLFKTASYPDAELGELQHQHGFWRGRLALGELGTVELIVAGDRKQPNPSALAAAKALPAGFEALRPRIEAALFEHLEPYADAGGEHGSFAPVEKPSAVWAQTKLLFIAVTLERQVPTIELGLSVAWDDEHTLGARIQSGAFVELCGSVLKP